MNRHKMQVFPTNCGLSIVAVLLAGVFGTAALAQGVPSTKAIALVRWCPAISGVTIPAGQNPAPSMVRMSGQRNA